MSTFLDQLQEEIITTLSTKGAEAKRSALSAVVHTAGNVVFKRQGVLAEIDLEASGVARFVAELMKEMGLNPEIGINKGHGIVRAGYRITVTGAEAKRLFSDLEILHFEGADITGMNRGVAPGLVDTEEKIRAYVSGVFLGAGTISVPTESEKAGYHFELRLSSQEFAREVMSLLAQFDVLAKSYDRENAVSVYVKESQAVCDVLAIMEASLGVMTVQNVVVERMVSNNDNRKRNCDVANLDKSVSAASRQIVAIERVFAKGLDRNLSADLIKTARARLDNPLHSLDMLAEMLGVSKSAINHRLRKLVELGKKENEDE